MSGTIIIRAQALTAFVAALFEAAGAPKAHAERTGEGLVAASLSGHDSHGVVRVPRYLQAIADGHLDPQATPATLSETATTLVVDGRSGLGMVIGRETMRRAIEKTQASGLTLVAIRTSFHLGRIGEWAEQCAEAGLVSLHFVNVLNVGGLVAPFGGKERRMSTNPFACGIPVAGGEPIILDMATSRIAEGKALVALNAGKHVPEGALIDAQGRPSRNPADLYGPPQGALLHFGEHKGYGLALICDLLAGALGGGGANHPGHPVTGAVHNNMLSILIDPAPTGGSAFGLESAAFIDWIKACAPVDPEAPVLVPGDPERAHRRQRLAHGVPLDAGTWASLTEAARALRFTPADIAEMAGVGRL
jgi:uncharacterized oxidoreductase